MTESAFAETAKPQISTAKKRARAKALIKLPLAITQPRYSLFSFIPLPSFHLKISPTPSVGSSPPSAGFLLHSAHYSLCRQESLLSSMQMLDSPKPSQTDCQYRLCRSKLDWPFLDFGKPAYFKSRGTLGLVLWMLVLSIYVATLAR